MKPPARLPVRSTKDRDPCEALVQMRASRGPFRNPRLPYSRHRRGTRSMNAAEIRDALAYLRMVTSRPTNPSPYRGHKRAARPRRCHAAKMLQPCAAPRASAARKRPRGIAATEEWEASCAARCAIWSGVRPLARARISVPHTERTRSCRTRPATPRCGQKVAPRAAGPAGKPERKLSARLRSSRIFPDSSKHISW